MESVYFDVWDQSSGNSLVSVPVGVEGLLVYEVPDDAELTLTSLTLWVKEDAGQPTPSIAVQLRSAQDPPDASNVFLWRSSPGDRRLSLAFPLGLVFPAGHGVLLRTAGQGGAAPAPEIGYSFQGVLVDA